MMTLTMLSGVGAHAAPVKVGVAAEPYPPFSSQDASGKWVGWEIEIIKAVCSAAKLDCVITPTAWDGLLPALMSGQIDAIMTSMNITEERLKKIDFSDKYYKTPVAIVGVKGKVMAPNAKGLSGMTIGVQAATIHQAYVAKHFKGSVKDVKLYQTQDEANQDLAAGRIDATQADSIAMDAFLATKEGSACCEKKGVVTDDPDVLGKGVAVGLRKGSQDLKSAFNAGISTIRKDGTYDSITAKYFKSSIYGN